MTSQLPAEHIRSFHARRGRSSRFGTAVVDRLWPRLGISVSDGPLDLDEVFGGLPVVLEIGFGLGDATVAMAAKTPEVAILAIEVHTPGISRLLARLEDEGLTNVRVAHGDAVELLRDQVGESSLAGIRVFFPDPWPKNRHHKRRLIQPELVALLASRLQPAGFVHLATDWRNYAEQMKSVLDAEPLLYNACTDFAGSPPQRPLTKYEAFGIAEGRTISDLLYRRRTAPRPAA